MKERIWECKIGGLVSDLPSGSDQPMRRAVEKAYRELTGLEPNFTFSGWAAELTKSERSVAGKSKVAHVAEPE